MPIQVLEVKYLISTAMKSVLLEKLHEVVNQYGPISPYSLYEDCGALENI